MSGKESYAGRHLTIHFDGDRCIHARNCVIGAPGVFRANVEGPWIDPDAADPDELAAIARACPSGAITYQRGDGRDERPPPVNTVRVRENGPLAVHGQVDIGGVGPCLRATLCRCGASAHKPLCDGAHATAGFTATGEPPTHDEVAALAARDGELSVTPRPDGPLIVTGNLEVLSGTGRLVRRTTRVALCRCGRSSTKPFCDGTHKSIGFTAPGP